MTVQNTPVAPQTWYTLAGQPLQLSLFAFDPANPGYQPGFRLQPGGPLFDSDGTPSVSGLPLSLGATFDPEMAQLTWTLNYSITVTATSNGGVPGKTVSSTTTIPIVVEPVVLPPSLAPISNASVAEGQTLDIPISVQAGDSNGNPVGLGA